MALPSTATEIYQLLTSDSGLVNDLGLYTFPGGSTAPAIAAYGANETSPAGTMISGVEVVIAQEVEQRPLVFVTGEGQLTQTWRLYVTQYGNQGSRLIQQVTTRILANLPGAYSVPVNIPAGPANGINVLSQVVITWKNPEGQIVFA